MTDISISRAMRLFSACIMVLLPSICPAEQLHFETLERKFQPTITESTVVASFPFTNQGTSSITIVELKTSCGCTTAELDKRTYGPGESGAINAIFTIGDRTGQQIKLITIKTDEDGQKPITLRMDMSIPEGPTTSSRFFDWYVGGGTAAKSVILTLPDASTFVVQRVECADKRFQVSLSPGVDGLHSIITVSPTDTSTTHTGVIDVITNLRTLHLYGRILSIAKP